MSVDPKKGGKCWSCKFCEDIGTQTCEDDVTYVRKCNKSDKVYIEKCDDTCADYVWDGHTAEYWKQAASDTADAPVFNSVRVPPAPRNSTAKWIIPVIVVIALLLVGVVALLIKSSRPSSAAGRQPTVSETAASTEAPTEAPTEPPSYETRIVRTKSGAGLNLREKPNVDAEVVVLMDYGASVKLMQERGDWAYVLYGEHTGWCSMKYLVSEEEAKDEPPADGDQSDIAFVVTESGNLRLRKEPSSDSEIIGALPKGAEVTVVKESGDWSYVKYKGEAGWCASKFLTRG